MTDESTTIAQLKELVRTFTRDRDWDQFHHPKDLGLALAIEVGELLEHFRYRSNDEVRDHLANADALRELSHEAADCIWLLLRLADVCRFDISGALVEKLSLAGEKYPVEKVRGRPDKYTAYRDAGREGERPRT